MKDEIIIIIPIFNEAENIKSVIDSLKEETVYDLLVVNDSSTDNSEKELIKNQVEFLSLPINLGIGGAVQTGMIYAKKNNYDIAVKFDGDGQHLATEIPKILSPILKNEADVVIGSRFLNKSQNFRSTFLRRQGIFFFKLVNFLLIHQIITDNTSGFRAYNQSAINFLCKNHPSEYPEPEEVVLLGKNKFRILEVPVKMKPREYGTSSIHGWKNVYYMLKVLLTIFMTALRRRIR